MLYTFYSYKGGVGRSMALANIAEYLYKANFSVLMVDWDLEAPGLERFFPSLIPQETVDKPGLMDMIEQYKGQVSAISHESSIQSVRVSDYLIDVYPNHDSNAKLFLLTSGRRTRFSDYIHVVVNFDWKDFYENWAGELYFEWLYKEFNSLADIVLIDSRTGINELSGVCTYQLADVLLMFCAPNQQNLTGTYEMYQRFKQPDLMELRHRGPLDILVIPARVEDRAEHQLLRKFAEQFQHTFDPYLQSFLGSKIDSFWRLKIPQVPYYAFNEVVAIREQQSERSEDLIEAYSLLADVMSRFLTLTLSGSEILSKEPSTCLIEIERIIKFYLFSHDWDNIAKLFDIKGQALYNYNRLWARHLDRWLANIPDETIRKYPRLILIRGVALSDLNQGEIAITQFRLSEKLFQKNDDPIGVAESKTLISRQLSKIGRELEEALRLSVEAVSLLEHYCSDEWLLGWSIRHRGVAYFVNDFIEKSLDDLEVALKCFRNSGDTVGTGLTLHDYAFSFHKIGKLSLAEDYYQRAKKIWQTENTKNDLALTLNNIGILRCERGQYADAIQIMTEGLELATVIDNSRILAGINSSLGDAYLGSKEYDRAREFYQTSMGFAQKSVTRWLEVYNLSKIGECYLSQNDISKAITHINQAHALAEELESSSELALVVFLKARIYFQLQDFSESIRLLKQASSHYKENIFETVEVQLWLAYSLLCYSRESEALNYARRAVKSILELEELTENVKDAIVSTRLCLSHFYQHTGINSSIRNSILVVLSQSTKLASKMPKIVQIFAFGTPFCAVDGKPIRFNQDVSYIKIPELLVYLLINGNENGCSGQELATHIWSYLAIEEAQAELLTSVQIILEEQHLSDLIIVENDFYFVNQKYFYWCDALAFDNLIQQLGTVSSNEEKMLIQNEIVHLYKGEFLASVSLGRWGKRFREICEDTFRGSISHKSTS